MNARLLKKKRKLKVRNEFKETRNYLNYKLVFPVYNFRNRMNGIITGLLYY